MLDPILPSFLNQPTRSPSVGLVFARFCASMGIAFLEGRVAEWSGELVPHPAIVQDGGFDSRRRQALRPSLPPGLR